jgi:Sulfotransferase domain
VSDSAPQAGKVRESTAPATPEVPHDPADEAMVQRARQRFGRAGRRRGRHKQGALPNLVVIGGLKCGTTSLHHYLGLHPEIDMSRPKELNYFIRELNWALGSEWYASHFDAGAAVRGETSPHYTNYPRFDGVAERMGSVIPDARLIYMVRNPIDRMLSHYLHNVAGGYDDRPLGEALSEPDSAYVNRSRYWMQLERYLERFDSRILVVAREDLLTQRAATMRHVFGYLGADEGFESPQFSREWETGTGKGSGSFRLMDRAVRLPGLRALDRNFDRLPEGLRWMVERVIHDPGAGEAPKPTVPDELRTRLSELFRDDVSRLEEFTGRRFGWLAG